MVVKTVINIHLENQLLNHFLQVKLRQLYPNEARLKNMTYGCDFFYSIDIEYDYKKRWEIN